VAGAVASELTIPSTIGILTTANAGRSPFHAGSPRSGGRLGQQAQQVGSIPANGDIIVTQKVLAREMIFKELNKTDSDGMQGVFQQVFLGRKTRKT